MQANELLSHILSFYRTVRIADEITDFEQSTLQFKFTLTSWDIVYERQNNKSLIVASALETYEKVQLAQKYVELCELVKSGKSIRQVVETYIASYDEITFIVRRPFYKELSNDP